MLTLIFTFLILYDFNKIVKYIYIKNLIFTVFNRNSLATLCSLRCVDCFSLETFVEPQNFLLPVPASAVDDEIIVFKCHCSLFMPIYQLFIIALYFSQHPALSF